MEYIKLDTDYITSKNMIVKISQDECELCRPRGEAGYVEDRFNETTGKECYCYVNTLGAWYNITTSALSKFINENGLHEFEWYDHVIEVAQGYCSRYPNEAVVFYNNDYQITDIFTAEDNDGITVDSLQFATIEEAENQIHGIVTLDKSEIQNLQWLLSDEVTLWENGDIYQITCFDPSTGEVTSIGGMMYDDYEQALKDYTNECYACGQIVEEFNPYKHITQVTA